MIVLMLVRWVATNISSPMATSASLMISMVKGSILGFVIFCSFSETW
jgi:hypothetical protein